MVSNKSRLNLYFDKELKEKILQNFQTDDVQEIKKLIMNFLEHGDNEFLSLKDQYLLERINKLRAETPLKTRKLQLQNEILEKKRDFLYHFEKPLSNTGSTILESEKKKQYGFAKSDNYHENIQLKKNFFINKINSGEYCGVCKICQNFTTTICTTSQEAEGDIELHLEAVHNTGLYQR